MSSYSALVTNSVRVSPALRIECRRCNAKPGRVCRAPSGKPAQWTHEVRIEDYEADQN